MYEFITPNNEYKIRVYKNPKVFSVSEYGKYDCHIEFIDPVLNRSIVNVCVTEKEFLHMFQEFGFFIQEIYNMYDTCVEFNSCNPGYYFYIAINDDATHPVEDEYDNLFSVNLFQNSIYGNKLRTSFNCNYYFFTDLFLDAIFRVIQDLPYFVNMNEDYIRCMFG